jgi:hypothetical protein
MPQDEALIAELTAPTYTFSSTGKLLVESRADMKKRGLRSPDLADAFLLTFASGERRKAERYRRPEPRNYSAWSAEPVGCFLVLLQKHYAPHSSLRCAA